MVERWTVNPEALIRYIVVRVHVGEPFSNVIYNPAAAGVLAT